MRNYGKLIRFMAAMALVAVMVVLSGPVGISHSFAKTAKGNNSPSISTGVILPYEVDITSLLPNSDIQITSWAEDDQNLYFGGVVRNERVYVIKVPKNALTPEHVTVYSMDHSTADRVVIGLKWGRIYAVTSAKQDDNRLFSDVRWEWWRVKSGDWVKITQTSHCEGGFTHSLLETKDYLFLIGYYSSCGAWGTRILRMDENEHVDVWSSPTGSKYYYAESAYTSGDDVVFSHQYAFNNPILIEDKPEGTASFFDNWIDTGYSCYGYSYVAKIWNTLVGVCGQKKEDNLSLHLFNYPTTVDLRIHPDGHFVFQGVKGADGYLYLFAGDRVTSKLHIFRIGSDLNVTEDSREFEYTKDQDIGPKFSRPEDDNPGFVWNRSDGRKVLIVLKPIANDNWVVNGEFNDLSGWEVDSKANNQYYPEARVIVDEEAQSPVLQMKRDSHGDSLWGGVVLTQGIRRSWNGVGSLLFSADIKAVYQSLAGGGWYGGEYPVSLRVDYLDEDGNEQSFVRNFYYKEGNVVKDAIKVQQGVWYHFQVNLGEIQPRPAYIEKVMVYASGWDFEGRVDNVYLGSCASATVTPAPTLTPVSTPTTPVPTPTAEAGTVTPVPPTPTYTPTPISTPIPTLTPTPTPTPEMVQKPEITEVSMCQDWPFYLQGVPLLNTYKVEVDWHRSLPGYVIFNLNGSADREAASVSPVSHTYNMGSELQYGLPPKRNELSIQAESVNGLFSDPMTYYPLGVGLPEWLKIPAQTSTSPCHLVGVGCGQLRIRCEREIPDPPFEFEFTPPHWFPFVGGKEVSANAQSESTIEVASTGKGSGEIKGDLSFHLGKDSITGGVTGSAETQIDERGFTIREANIRLEGRGEVRRESPLVDVLCKAVSGGICPLREWENNPVIGGLVKKFDNMAKVQAKIEPGVDLGATFQSDERGKLAWKNIEGGGSLGMKLALIVDVIKGLSASLYGGGKGSLEFQLPASPSYLKEAVLELLAGLKLHAYGWEMDFGKVQYTFTWTPGGTSSGARKIDSPWLWFEPGKGRVSASRGLIPAEKGTGSWHPIPRVYAQSKGNYALFEANLQRFHPFVGRVQALRSMALKGKSAEVTEEQLLVSNVFPEAHPVIVSLGDKLLYLWSHDDVSRPLMQGEEIYYSVFDGTRWSTPAGITQDSLEDFYPRAIVDNAQNVLVVWERNKEVHTEDETLTEQYMNDIELAYSVWDGQQWSSPQYITRNGALDHDPILASDREGKVVLVWRQNDAGKLMGTEGHPDRFYWTEWNGQEWSAPQEMFEEANIIGMSVAKFDAGHMVVAYSKDMDGDLSTPNDQEVFLTMWNGEGWGQPIRVTDDDQPDNRPTVRYDNQGNLVLVWLKGDKLYGLIGGLAGDPHLIAEEKSAGILDYALAQSPQGDLVVVWQGNSAEGIDLYYAVYDQESGKFSRVLQLTHDKALEKFFVPTFDSQGALLLAYQKDQLKESDVNVEGEVVHGVITFGRSDLYVLRHTLGPDLEVEAKDIKVSPEHPGPGDEATVQITVKNRGDRAVEHPQVALYQIDADGRGSRLVKEMSWNGTLVGGGEAVFTSTWKVPNIESALDLKAIVDPYNEVVEWSEGNNQAEKAVVVPDLKVEELGVRYPETTDVVTLTARVANVGNVPIGGAVLTVRMDDPDNGTVIAQKDLTQINASEHITVTVPWDTQGITTGWHRVYVDVQPTEVVTEANVENNISQIDVGIVPEFVVEPDRVEVEKVPGRGMNLHVWVENRGLRDSTGVKVGAYAELPEAGAQPLADEVVDIPAGEMEEVTLKLTHVQQVQVYVGVNIDGEVEERDPSDNVAQVLLPNVFSDVADDHWAVDFINRLYRAGVTGGCALNPLRYCPDNPVTRAQMAVFLEKGMHYPNSYSPPDVGPTFPDTAGHWAEDWIEALKSDGITSGFPDGTYRPESPVTRAQMAVFLLKAKHGASYQPPAVDHSRFSDVPDGHWAKAWIEELAAEGITSGYPDGTYRPENPVSRAEMSVFLVKTFELP